MVWLPGLQARRQNQSNAACLTGRGQEARKRAARALTLLAWVHVRGQLHIIGWEEPDLPVDFSFPPVGVLLVEDVDDLALAEGQLVIVLCGVIVHPDHLAHCGRQGCVSSCAAQWHVCSSRYIPGSEGASEESGASLYVVWQQRKIKDYIFKILPFLNVIMTSQCLLADKGTLSAVEGLTGLTAGGQSTCLYLSVS